MNLSIIINSPLRALDIVTLTLTIPHIILVALHVKLNMYLVTNNMDMCDYLKK